MTPKVHYDAEGPKLPALSEQHRTLPISTFCGVDLLTRDRFLTRTWKRVTCRRCRRKGGR
jgi:hypothetical protein